MGIKSQPSLPSGTYSSAGDLPAQVRVTVSVSASPEGRVTGHLLDPAGLWSVLQWVALSRSPPSTLVLDEGPRLLCFLVLGPWFFVAQFLKPGPLKIWLSDTCLCWPPLGASFGMPVVAAATMAVGLP